MANRWGQWKQQQEERAEPAGFGGEGRRPPCESAALNMPANLENSAMVTGLEKVSFHPNLRKAMPKNAPTATQLHSSHTTAK